MMIMTTETTKRNVAVKELLNSTYQSIKTVIPVENSILKPEMITKPLDLQFGVLIGIVGDMKGKLMVTGKTSTFSMIGEAMFGMHIEGEMLSSFSGELGNMIAGNISTSIVKNGINIDITSPTIMQGNTIITGYNQALKLNIIYPNNEEMALYLLFD